MKRSLALALTIAACSAAPASAQEYGVDAWVDCAAEGNVFRVAGCTVTLAQDLTDGGQLSSLPRCAKSATLDIVADPGFTSILGSQRCVETWTGSDVPVIEIG